MNNYRIDPKQQFSKKLARWTAVFWFIYMLYLITVLLLEPSTGIYTVYISIVVSIVMIVNVLAYTRNSVMEKLAFMTLDSLKIKLSLDKEKEPSSDDGEQEDGNG